MSPYCMSKGLLIGGAPAPSKPGMVSILVAPKIHPIAVALCDNSLQKITISSESTSQDVESGLMPCSQILSPLGDL